MSKKWYHYFVVTTPSDPAAAPSETLPERQPRVVDIVPDAETDATFTAPITPATDLEAIYRSAQIPTPAHGYTVLKIADMLQSEHIRALPADVKQRSILVALEAAGVTVAEIVEDAVQRDRALDTYERVLQKHLDDLRSEKAIENRQLEEEITKRAAELRARIDQNNVETSREQDDLTAWRAGKRREEARIAEAVGHFVSANPITAEAALAKGGSDVR